MLSSSKVPDLLVDVQQPSRQGPRVPGLQLDPPGVSAVGNFHVGRPNVHGVLYSTVYAGNYFVPM